MRNVVALSIFVAVMVVPACIGAFAPVGICVTIWRYDCVESLIGPTSDRSQPASWVFLTLLVPSGLIAIAGATTLYLAMLHFFPWLVLEMHHSSRRNEARLIRWERRMAVAWGRNLRFRHRRLAEAKAKGNTHGASKDRAWGDELA